MGRLGGMAHIISPFVETLGPLGTTFWTQYSPLFSQNLEFQCVVCFSYRYLFGLYSFGLEETNFYSEAEIQGRKVSWVTLNKPHNRYLKNCDHLVWVKNRDHERRSEGFVTGDSKDRKSPA